MNWDLVDNIFLDMDGTLLDLHFDNYFWLQHLPKHLASIRAESEISMRDYLRGEYENLRGQLNWYCLEYWQQKLDIDIVALKREVIEKIQFRPHAEFFLSALGGKNKQVALVTNAHRWSLALKMESVLSESAFDRILSSHDFGLPKEQPQFWARLRSEYDFDPERTLLIDDNEDVLRSAREFGIAHLLSVHQPDMTQPPQAAGEFEQIKDFRALL